MSLTAADYPTTTPFGYAPGYDRNGGFHTGVDRAMPLRTPLVVDGWLLGYSGNTGDSTGPHLHTGRFINGKAVDPGQDGFNFGGRAVVYDTGYDSVNGRYIRLTVDGVLWFYGHLDEVSGVKGKLTVVGGKGAGNPGAELNKGEPMVDENTARDLLVLATLNPDPSQEAINSLKGQPYPDVIRALIKNGEHRAIVDQFNQAGWLSKRVADLERELAAEKAKQVQLDTANLEPAEASLLNKIQAFFKRS